MRDLNTEPLSEPSIESDPSIPDEERVFSDRELAKGDAGDGTSESAAPSGEDR
jgi:hypothetical protein